MSIQLIKKVLVEDMLVCPQHVHVNSLDNDRLIDPKFMPVDTITTRMKKRPWSFQLLEKSLTECSSLSVRLESTPNKYAGHTFHSSPRVCHDIYVVYRYEIF